LHTPPFGNALVCGLATSPARRSVPTIILGCLSVAAIREAAWAHVMEVLGTVGPADC
jgi:hypothetical protein